MKHIVVRGSCLLLFVIVMVTSGCTKGQGLRGTTSVAVKAALSDNHVKYKGDITCTGDSLPITCTSTSTDGRPISGTLSTSDGSGCVLVVAVGGQQIVREKGGKCK
jgi:hypothetical protein